MKLGFSIKDLGPSQLSYYAVKNTNAYVRSNHDISIIGFYENLIVPCVRPEFPVMDMVEVFGYDGNVVATDLNSAAKLINSFSPAQRFFYVWDLEWMRLPYKQYEALYRIYNSPKLKLLARSDEHARAIENCWDKKVTGIVENFNYEQLLTYIRG